MRIFFIYFFLLSSAVTAFSQQVVPVLLTPLPVSVIESSGVETATVSGAIWTHNDSGGMPEIYKADTAGNLLRTVFLSGVTAIDFEDITRDSVGNIYIGDFGDNAMLRANLQVYKIPPPESFYNDTVSPEVISFSYSTTGQTFDCEAFFHHNETLYLFTKSHNSGEYTKLYVLPDSAGTYIATLVDSFYFGNPITAADISPNGNTIALLSYGKLYLLSAFTGNNFFSGTVSAFTIPLSQTEGLAFISNTRLYMTDELLMAIGGNLYYLDIQPGMTDMYDYNDSDKFIVYPNPCNGNFTIVIANEVKQSHTITITDTQGRMIFEKVFNEKTVPLNLSEYSQGVYFIKVQTENEMMTRKIVIR